MLKACYKAITLIAATVGFLTPLTRATAQTTQVLVDWTSTWRWEQSGTELGTAWRDYSYPAESTWAMGQGLLGAETTPAVYPAPFNTALAVPTPLTAYFRIHFNYTGATNGVTLIASNVVDDGYVMFLNGTEVSRLRVAAGQNSTSQATAGPATEGAIELATLPAGALRSGDNVLAVEVHQNGTGSSDIAWGTKLVIIAPVAVAITTQPQSQTIALGSPVTFTVGISGGPANYQWTKDGGNISNATNSSYTIGTVSAGSAGSYRVRVFNSVNSVTSAPAVLTVVSDTTPPSPTAAVVREVTFGSGSSASLTFTNIEITVDEPLTVLTATNWANYVVRNFDTPNSPPLPVVGVLYNYPTVRVSVATNSNWFYRSNYFVRVSNWSDTRGNIMEPTDVGVAWRVTTNLMQMSQPWSFFDSAFLSTAPYLNGQWKNTNYVTDFLWGTGEGILSFGLNNQTVLCTGDDLATTISYQLEPTLFRRTFMANASFSRGGTLQLRHFIDDGAVFYLNGLEIYRYNMSPAVTTVNTNTRALANLDPTCITNITVNVTNLFPTMNWMAVAVCAGPGNDGDGDSSFGLEVDGIYNQTGPIPSPISISRSGAIVQVSWVGTGYVLQSSSNPANPASWTPVAGAVSPYTAGPNLFYRLRRP